jgi:hypothetical protein
MRGNGLGRRLVFVKSYWQRCNSGGTTADADHMGKHR